MADEKVYAKADDNTLRKTETVTVVSDISLDVLIERRQSHAQAKADAIAYFDKCIADLDTDIAEAQKLSLKTIDVINAEAVAANEAAEAVIQP